MVKETVVIKVQVACQQTAELVYSPCRDGTDTSLTITPGF